MAQLTDEEILRAWHFVSARERFVIAGPNIRRIMVASVRLSLFQRDIVTVCREADMHRVRGLAPTTTVIVLSDTDPVIEAELKRMFYGILAYEPPQH